MEIHESIAPPSTIQDELSAIEAQLIGLTRGAAAAGERPLDEIITELTGLAVHIRRGLSHVQESLERRDLTYDDAAELQEVRRRALWLYRRSRLEQLFYRKLLLERLLRDSLYRQVLETYEELSSLEAEERRLHALPEDVLVVELFREGQSMPDRDGAD